MISNTPKKCYKIICNAFDTTSWGGQLYNAVFPLDLKTVISDPDDFNKPYLMTFQFQSLQDSNIFYDGAYGIHIHFQGTKTNVMQSNNNAPNNLSHGVLVCVTYQGQSSPKFQTQPYDNDPVYYENLNNITSVQIRVISLQTVPPSTFVATSGTKYWICTITFTEA
jgi:hypothetical protein